MPHRLGLSVCLCLDPAVGLAPGTLADLHQLLPEKKQVVRMAAKVKQKRKVVSCPI